MEPQLNPDQERRALVAFKRAADLPVGEDEAYLEQECGDDPAVHTHAFWLLKEYRRQQGSMPTETDSQAAANATSARIGEPGPPPQEKLTFAEFEYVRGIGRGGMGVVFEARDRNLRSRVAFKVINCPGNMPSWVSRFKREMRTQACLHHENIAIVHRGGEANSLLYFVMEYLQGVELGRFLKHIERTQGHLASVDACEIARQAACGLAYAHTVCVHRDIKPSNLVLTTDGVVKLVDWGLARSLREDAAQKQVTRTGTGMGTDDYIAPEQWDDARSVDHRVDIYALGCTLYHLLAGSPPFAEFENKRNAHHAAPIPSLGTVRQDVPEGLQGVLEKMMAKDREARYSSAADVADALSPFCANADLKKYEKTVQQALNEAPENEIEETARATAREIGFSEPLLTYSNELRVQGVAIPNHGVELRLWDEPGGGVPLTDIECETEVSEIEPLTGVLLEAQKLYAEVRQLLAKQRGRTFDNNSLLGIRSFCVIRRDEGSRRRRYARIGFRQTCYFDHVFLGEALRLDISRWFKGLIQGDEVRDPKVLERMRRFSELNPTFIPAEQLGIPHDLTDLKLEDAQKLPMLPFRLGLAVVIITADNKVIVPLRSGRVDIGETQRPAYSASVGEGMALEDTVQGLERLRLKMAEQREPTTDKVGHAIEEGHAMAPSESQESKDPSLVALAARALYDEMGIRDGIDCDVGRDVRCVAVNFDRREAFPYLTTVLKVRQRFDEVIGNAADSWENQKVLGLPWHEQKARELFMGETEVPGEGKIVAASAREQVFFGQAWLAFKASV